MQDPENILVHPSANAGEHATPLAGEAVGCTQGNGASAAHQSQLAPEANKFHVGNGDDGKHYWLTPPALYQKLAAEIRNEWKAA